MITTPRSKVGSAVKLTVASTVLSGLFQAIVIVVLARLIGPAEYGAYTLGVAILSVTTNFVTNSIERALVVAETVDLKGLTATVSLVALGAALLTLTVTAIPIQKGWLATRTDLLAGLLTGGVIGSLGVVPRVYLRRNLTYSWIVGGELAGIMLGVGATAITLAWLGFGAYALIGGAVVQNLTTIGVLILGAPQAASMRMNASAFRTVRGSFSASRLAALEVVHGQIPNFFIGSLGPTALGLFNRSQAIVQIPVQLLTASISRVMISGLSTAMAERQRFLRATRLTVVTTGAIIGPVNFGIAGSHNAFTAVILGHQWAAAAPLVPLLALTSWALMTASVLGSVSEAARRFTNKAKLQAAASVVLILCLCFGVRFGLLPAAIGMSLGAMFMAAANVWLTARVLEIEITALARWLTPGLTAGFGCGLYSWAVSLWPAPDMLVFCAQVAGCGLITGGYYLALQQEVLLVVAGAVLPSRLVAPLQRLLSRPAAP